MSAQGIIILLCMMGVVVAGMALASRPRPDRPRDGGRHEWGRTGRRR